MNCLALSVDSRRKMGQATQHAVPTFTVDRFAREMAQVLLGLLPVTLKKFAGKNLVSVVSGAKGEAEKAT